MTATVSDNVDSTDDSGDGADGDDVHNQGFGSRCQA